MASCRLPSYQIPTGRCAARPPAPRGRSLPRRRGLARAPRRQGRTGENAAEADRRAARERLAQERGGEHGRDGWRHVGDHGGADRAGLRDQGEGDQERAGRGDRAGARDRRGRVAGRTERERGRRHALRRHDRQSARRDRGRRRSRRRPGRVDPWRVEALAPAPDRSHAGCRQKWPDRGPPEAAAQRRRLWRGHAWPATADRTLAPRGAKWHGRTARARAPPSAGVIPGSPGACATRPRGVRRGHALAHASPTAGRDRRGRGRTGTEARLPACIRRAALGKSGP